MTQVNPKLKTSDNMLTLEVRSKEAQLALMNQSLTGSFNMQNQQKAQAMLNNTTPKQTYLPTIVQNNTSPKRKIDSTTEYLNLNAGGGASASKQQDPLNVTKQTFIPVTSSKNAVQSSIASSNTARHQKGRSLEPIGNRAVQFREEISNGQLSALMQVMNNNQQPQVADAQASVFGNYIMKVVQSVERRKQKQKQNMLQIVNSQTQKLALLVDADNHGYTTSGVGLSKKSSQATTAIALQNFNNQIIQPERESQHSADLKRKLKSKQQSMYEATSIIQPRELLNGSQFSDTQAIQLPLSTEKRSSSINHSQSERASVLSSSKQPSNNNQVAIVGFNSVFQEPKATEQVAFLLKEAQRKDKIFIPLERAPDVDSGLMYKEMKNAPDNHAGIVVFSKAGFVSVGKAKNATSEFISNENFITDGVNKYILKDLPFYKKFHAMKVFKQWKYIMKWNAYKRKRLQLANAFHLAKPMFSERYSNMIPLLNNVRTLPFVDIKHNVTYGKKQQQLLEEKCNEQIKTSKLELDKTLKSVKSQVEVLKEEIQQDDRRYEHAVKERRMMEIIKQSRHGGEDLIMFSKARKQKEAEEEQFRVQKQRQGLFDKFVQFVLKIVCANLVEASKENKRIFKEIFRDQRLGPQFEVSVCFNEHGVLDTDPSMNQHRQSFQDVFLNIEVTIFQNQCLIDFINDLVGLLFTEKKIYYKNIFENMKKTLNENIKHQENHNAIFDILEKDIQRCQDYLSQFVSLQEIYDFANDWESNQRDKQVSLEMSFYKETWLEMDKYALMVEKIPTSNTKLGTILVETLSLKKYLSELPKKVIDSIRSNVTNTMETETKSLREELSKTSEILDQLPGSLNVYVEQVNTLKYVKEKQEEFTQKFNTINKLHQLCKQDNIKVSLNLQQAIEEVSHLYETLPKLQKRAQDGLNNNKDTMEKIMHSSSLVLSKKIKAFEKKYVETYLQDRSRIEDCADTLEELFKRSKAIHEIRSKVILYKEFLKLLYEDDPFKEEKMQANKLQCSEDYEFVADLHKQTIKLWKMLLYWRKRRHMCYNTPFLSLDMNKIIRSINKINRYFEEKLSKNDFLKEKSRPLYKVVMLQVKETSLIIEFLKDLRRESLQQRHWLQIFHLIKAPHLKNSTTFTIVNLREYHVQNYRDEISRIIEHANTELKYERVYKSIKEEWDKHELKIIPYKETMDSYILVSTETLSSAIEENLTTLENISQSKYAAHIKQDIEDWIKTLRQMLKNLEIWVNAQHHWINLDPILQSEAYMAEILKNDAKGIGFGNYDIDDNTSEFLDLRNQFKRIMWSSFKKPKATYNLMIKSRIEVFEKLTKHFAVLQKKVHDFLEQRRRAFPRFFFLTDNQFLEFLTLANSNQDFNEYINVLFQGAHKLFINRILGKEPLNETVQLEKYISSAIQHFELQKDEQAANIEPNENLGTQGIAKGAASIKNPPGEESDDLRTEFSASLMSSEKKRPQDTVSFKSFVNKDDGASATPGEAQQIKITPSEDQNEKPRSRKDDDLNKSESKVSDSFEVLGMISLNKELFLFERPVQMVDGVEKWLVQVEKSMQETISKMLSYAVSSFPNLPLDEWILDYPQQIILSVLHLILSHEINEVLESTKRNLMNPQGAQGDPSLRDGGESQQELQNDGMSKAMKRISITRKNIDAHHQQPLQHKKSHSSESKSGDDEDEGKKGSDDEDEDPGMAEYIRRKNELRAQQQAEEEETKKKMAEESRKKFEANELPRDPEKEKRQFIDEMFGFDFPITSRLLVEELNINKENSEQASQSNLVEHNKQLTASQQNKALKLMASKKTDFKEIIIENLHKKSLKGINLRIHFWMNSVIKGLYKTLGGLLEKEMIPNITLHSIQKMIMKSIAAFLLYQRDIVDNLMNKNITDIEEFEWQAQIRLFWTGSEPACKVLCGGWSDSQQNEYLGSNPRLIITPLTNRYFVFISSALREKSAVLFNSSEASNSIAGDVFEEFSNICMTPFKKFVCSPIIDLKPLMQSLNGAALSSFWVFYKNIDKLQFSYLQTFNKEIQLLQQQFIFNELAGAKIPSSHNIIQRDLMFKSDSNNRSGHLDVEGTKSSDGKTKNFPKNQNATSDPEMKSAALSIFSKGHKLSHTLGIFATISPIATIKNQVQDTMLSQLSASFRVLSFCRFNERVLFISILKTEGFYNYALLARLSYQFLMSLYDTLYAQPVEKTKLGVNESQVSILSRQQNLSPDEDSLRHLLSLRDLRLVAKLACLIREQERRVYHQKIIDLRSSLVTESERAKYNKNLKREHRMKELIINEMEGDIQTVEDRQIEVKSIQEGLRLVCRQKLFSIEWIKQHDHIVNNHPDKKGVPTTKQDQYAQFEGVEKQIAAGMEQNFDKQRRDDEEELSELHKKYHDKVKQIEAKEREKDRRSYDSQQKSKQEQSKVSLISASIVSSLNKQSSVYANGALIRRKSISNADVASRYSSNIGITEFKHNSQKVTENKMFIEQVTRVLKELIEKLNFDKSNAQLRNCVNVLDLFRRQKAIAFVGSVCSGKTTILKIVSNALHVAFKVKLRTSVINTATMTPKELYGSIDAFTANSHNTNDSSNSNSSEGDFSKSGIFKIILDVFEKERAASNAIPSSEDKPKLVQSIFFDSCEIDQPLSECLLDFIDRTNKREELNKTSTEFLLDFKLSGEIKQPPMIGDERIPVTFPNGNVIQFPSDLFLFFETTSLRDASPPFVSKVGLIVVEEDDLSWQAIYHRQLVLFLKKQDAFFKEQNFLNAVTHVNQCSEEFIKPFLEKVTTNQRLTSWEFLNTKAATLQLFNVLNCLFFKLRDVIKQRKLEEDNEYEALLGEAERDLFWSNCLLACIWSFGALLPRELKRPFEEVFQPFKRKFNMNMSSSATAQSAGARNRFTIFDVYYDPESLQWELLQENIDYKLKLQYEPLSNQLLIPTVEVSQCFFMMDILISSGPRYDENNLDNKHFRALGPSGVGKSFAINTYLKRINGDSKFQITQIPMSAYLTIERVKETVEQFYVYKRRNLLEPKDKERNIVLMIDDVHLQSNLKVNILEFLRTWCMSKGYYDIQQGFFKGIGRFVTVLTENSDYRRTDSTKFPGRVPMSSHSRFLFYTNTIYLDEYDSGGIERYKSFTQQWFTSKLWTTSKLLNKYYILIQNTLLSFIEKLRRIDAMHNSSLMKLTNFHFFQKFCSNLVAYTIALDEKGDAEHGLKEEDTVSNLMIYEIMRMYGDRLHRGSQKNTLMQKLVECCKQEFVGRSTLTTQHIDSLVVGNYHEKRPGACIKYSNVSPQQHKEIKETIKKKLRECTNNQFLEAFLDAPNSVREIFKLSRLLYKDMQHAILVGPAGCGKLEYLQTAAVLNEALIFEINCSRLCEPFAFVNAFKKAVISATGLNKLTFIAINETQLRDSVYIDFVHNFMMHMCNKYEASVLWVDVEFKKSLINIEKELYNQSVVKRAAEPTEDQLLVQAMRKIQKNVHIVLMIDDFQTYFEWISLFPQLEAVCEVSYMDEQSAEGYKQFTSNFFQIRGSENQIFQDQKLLSALVELRQIVKNNIVNIFHSPSMLKFTCTEEYMSTALTEFLFNSEEKLNGYLYADGNFRVRDQFFRQYNYNMPVSITSLYKSRYVMFLELFRYIYDFVALGLVVRRNYYEAFLRKSAEFSEFFKDINISKKTLHGESYQLTYKVAAMRDKVTKLKSLIEDRERLINKKTTELKEVELELQTNQDEIDQALEERDMALDEILNHFEKVTGSEFIYILNQSSRITEKEYRLLDLVAILIDRNGKIEGYNKALHSAAFQDRAEFIEMLDERRMSTLDDSIFTRIKDFLATYTIMDYKDKPLFKMLFTYFNALFKKLNLRNTMANSYSRIKQFQAQYEQVQFTLNYSNNYINEKKLDLQEIEDKYKELALQDKKLSMKIEEAEISHMRTDHIIQQIMVYQSKVAGKLTKVKKRLDTLLGDSVILASSIAFLGCFSIKERKHIRKEMAEYLNSTTSGFIKCGAYWTENGGANNSKLFRAVLKEYGIGGNSAEDAILSTIPQGILSQETLIEAVFTLMFSPSCPYVVDPTGQLQNFLQGTLLNKLQSKTLYASDQGINGQLEAVFRSNSTFALINDMNDQSQSTFGLSQDESLLSRLTHVTLNGFEHDLSLLKSPFISKNLLQSHSVHTTHTSVNKRLSISGGEIAKPMHAATSTEGHMSENFSFYQVQIFSPRFDFALNSDYMARATMLVAIDDDENSGFSQIGNNTAWIDIKELMLKHFLPDECKKLQEIKEKIRKLERHKNEIYKNFESAFLVASQDTLKNLSQYSSLKQAVEDIKYYDEEKKQINDLFQVVLSNYPLLSSYANVISIMFQALKKLSKIAGIVTYSWKLFTDVVEAVFEKTVREITAKAQAQNHAQNQKSTTSIIIDSQGRLAVMSTKQLNPTQSVQQIDFTLDEEFFSTQVIPNIYGVILSSFKSQLTPLFNLIFAVKLAFKKREINDQEVEYFFRQLFTLKNFEKWREIESNFVDSDERVEKTRFLMYKREVIKLYPEQGRKIIDLIEKDITQSFQYKQASHCINFKVFSKASEYSKMKLFQQINIGFISPDHEFKTKLIQLVYEQLSSVFSFTEEPMKVHDFVKLASWQKPIALMPIGNINTINAICSMASYYGISLEILRSSELPGNGDTTQGSGENAELKQQVQSQLNDYTHQADGEAYMIDASQYKRDSYVGVNQDDLIQSSIYLPKANAEMLQSKEKMRADEKAILGAYQGQDPIEVIQRCATQGTWVFISCLRFPNYWHKMVSILSKLREENKISNTFRLFIDLQGYIQNEIPDSFLFDHAISFYLTEKNNSAQLDQVQDIWSSLLNPRVLSEMTDYKALFAEDIKQILTVAVAEEMSNAMRSLQSGLRQSSIFSGRMSVAGANKGAPNIKDQQEQHIKDSKQRELYGQYMMHMQPLAEQQAKKFNQDIKDQDQFLAEIGHVSNSSQTNPLNIHELIKQKLSEGPIAGVSEMTVVTPNQKAGAVDDAVPNQMSPSGKIESSLEKNNLVISVNKPEDEEAKLDADEMRIDAEDSQSEEKEAEEEVEQKS